MCRATLDMSLRHIHLEKKNLHDVHSRKSREKDRDLRNMKKSELHFKVAEEGLVHTKSIHEKVKSQLDSLPKDDGTLMKKREELTKEVDYTKRALAQQVRHSFADLFHNVFTCVCDKYKPILCTQRVKKSMF